MTGDNAMDKLKGKGKEAVCKLTGDRRKESEGKADQAKATVESLGLVLGGASGPPASPVLATSPPAGTPVKRATAIFLLLG